MIPRNKYLKTLDASINRAPVVSLLGPRQCGKTTLARLFGNQSDAAYFDLESLPDQRRLQNPVSEPHGKVLPWNRFFK